jgi:hypothetical protein
MVVLASPTAKAPSGELSVSGQVTVNGEKAFSGGTLFSDSMMTTAEKSSATVTFNQKSVMGLLDNGSAQVSTLAGISVSFTTKDAVVVVDGSQPTSFTVRVVEGVTSLTTHSGLAQLRVLGGAVKNVAAGESATAGTPQTGCGSTPCKAGGLSGGALAALLLAAGGAILAAILAGRDNNDVNFGGNAIVISPAR